MTRKSDPKCKTKFIIFGIQMNLLIAVYKLRLFIYYFERFSPLPGPLCAVGAGVFTAPPTEAGRGFDCLPRALRDGGPVGCRLQAFLRTVGDSQRVRHRPDRIVTGRRPQSPDKGGKAAISSRHCLKNSLPPQKAGHRTGFRSAPSVPLPRIFSFQALGKITDDPESQGHQPVHPASALPDGNTGCDPAHVETGRLGRVHRFIGRVPPRPHRPPVLEASRLFVRGQGVPIQSPPLRPKARPPAVHPAVFSGCGLPPGTRLKGVSAV